MKKLFTLLVALLCAVGFASAQTYEWYVQGDKAINNATGIELSVSKGSADASYNTKFTGTYTGLSGTKVVCTKGVKMEAATTITFTTTQPAKVVIVQSTADNSTKDKTIKFDDSEVNLTSGVEDAANTIRVYTINNVAAGEHKISRGSGEAGLIYVGVEYYASEDDALPEAKISWEGGDVTFKVREEIPVLPTFKKEGEYAVTFASSNVELATVSETGVITVNENVIGNAVISATVEGDEAKTYKTTTATVKIECKTNVVSAVAGVETHETFVMSKNVHQTKSGNIAAGSTYFKNDAITITMPYTSYVTKESKTVSIFNRKYDYYAQVRVKAVPDAENATGTDNYDGSKESTHSSPLVIEPKVDMTLVVFGRRQTLKDAVTTDDDVENNIVTETQYWGATANDGKSLKFVNQSAPTELLDQEVRISDYTDDTFQYCHVATFVELKAGETYTAFASGTTYGVYGFGYIVEDVEAPTHDHGETFMIGKDVEVAEITLNPTKEHHLVYYCFEPTEPAEANEESDAARATAPETLTIDKKTYTLAENGIVKVSQSGTLSYVAYDPITEVHTADKGGAPATLVVIKDTETGIATIAAEENEAVEYYNLQGQRVANPAQGGLYIRKAGSKAEKVIL